MKITRPLPSLTTLLLLSIAATLLGQTQTAPNGAGRVEGRIIDQNGDPIPRATVRFLGSAFYAGELASRADDEGRYVFPEVAAGRWHVRAERTGYVTQYFGAKQPDSEGALVQVVREQTTTAIDFVLTQQAVITGRVTDLDGNPWPDAIVSIYQYDYDSGAPIAMSGPRYRTGADGAYRIPELAPGSYFIGTWDTAAGVNGVKRPATYFPGTTDFNRAQPLTVEPGEELSGVSLIAREESAYFIRGSALLPNPAATASVRILSAQSERMFENQGNWGVKDGKFQIPGTLPGSYRILGIGRDPDINQTLYADLLVTVGSADLENVQLPFAPGVVVTSTVVLDQEALNDGAAAPEMNVSLQSIYPRPMVAVNPIRPMGVDGVVQHGALMPGPYQLWIPDLPSAYYLKSVTSGDQDGLTAPLTFSGSAAQVDIVLGSDGATLTGAVTDINGDPAVGATILLWPKTPWNGLRHDIIVRENFLTTTTDQNGRYEITAIRPEDYFVAAWEDVSAGPVRELDEFRQRFLGSALELTLEANSIFTADLLMVPASQVLAELEAVPLAP